jgi:flagellar motor switch protein FliM
LPEVLSQKELDKLFANAGVFGPAEEVADEKPDTKKQGKDTSSIKYDKHDFATAQKFTREQLRSLKSIHERFAREASTYLTNLLKTTVEIEVLGDVEEMEFKEFFNALPTPLVIAELAVHPLYASLILQMGSDTIYNMIARIFGGTSGNLDSSKEFSEIECEVSKKILKPMVERYNDSWNTVTETKITVADWIYDPQFAMLFTQTEAVALVTMMVSMDNVETPMTVCIPHIALQPIAKKLSQRQLISTNTVPIAMRGQYDEYFSKKLMETKLTLYANFDTMPMPAIDLMTLQVGDVIKLNHKAGKDITVNVEHIPKFHAAIGFKGMKKAVQVVDIIKSEEDEVNDG